MDNYNFLHKALHDLVLSNNFFKKSIYEVEKIFFLKNNREVIENEKHIFISGLPRSGTTILLNFLYETNCFNSLTYENMPFIMAPNLFSKIPKKKNIIKKERMHRDGIYYDLKSPEAFDEIFFSTFDENKIKEELVNFVTLILKNKNGIRYLSKNNLNYKRIDLIQNIFPNSIFLIPFREPIQHAYSLFNQHKLFIKIQNKNNFVLRYMNYLKHNEFGKNHKAWHTSRLYNDNNDLNYWLEQWLMFYSNILKKYKIKKNCYLINYEKLKNVDYINNLIKILDLKNDYNLQFKIKERKITENFDKSLYLESKELYDLLLKNSIIPL